MKNISYKSSFRIARALSPPHMLGRVNVTSEKVLRMEVGCSRGVFRPLLCTLRKQAGEGDHGGLWARREDRPILVLKSALFSFVYVKGCPPSVSLRLSLFTTIPLTKKKKKKKKVYT